MPRPFVVCTGGEPLLQLDQAAVEIRDLPLAPETQNNRHIGMAMSEVFEIMRSIWTRSARPYSSS
jgi:organic radical activating enzyme